MHFPGSYMPLYNASARAIKDVHPSLRVGGPATANLIDLANFTAAADAANIPWDFVSSHKYPTDGNCPGGASGGAEWGPDCHTRLVKAARMSLPADTTFFLTEYNVGCCLGYAAAANTHDSPAAAAFIFRQVGELAGVVDMLSWWTFTDVFEEAGIPTSEFTNTYGLMSLGGIPKPGWRAFQLLHQHAGTLRHPVTVTEHAPDPPVPPPPPVPPVCVPIPGMNFSMNPSAVPHHQDSWATNADTAGDCCDLCRNYSDCAFWTWAGWPVGWHTPEQQLRQLTQVVEGSTDASMPLQDLPGCGGAVGNSTNLTLNPSIQSLGHHQPQWYESTPTAGACCEAC